MTPTNSFDERKFDELVLYVAMASFDDPRYGAVKLNKILFYSDFFAFVKLGRPITGATYQKLEQGPCARQMKPRLMALEQSQAAVEVLRPSGSFIQKRLTALRVPDLSLFRAEEIAIVDEVLRHLLPHGAAGVSNLSHQLIGWKLAGLGETIPYETALIPSVPLPLSPREIAHGQRIAAGIVAE